jgi:hypothetical protein
MITLEVLKMYHSLTHGAEPFLRSCQLCSYSRTSQHFMEPEGSLLCSQEPSTGFKNVSNGQNTECKKKKIFSLKSQFQVVEDTV